MHKLKSLENLTALFSKGSKGSLMRRASFVRQILLTWLGGQIRKEQKAAAAANSTPHSPHPIKSERTDHRIQNTTICYDMYYIFLVQ